MFTMCWFYWTCPRYSAHTPVHVHSFVNFCIRHKHSLFLPTSSSLDILNSLKDLRYVYSWTSNTVGCTFTFRITHLNTAINSGTRKHDINRHDALPDIRGKTRRNTCSYENTNDVFVRGRNVQNDRTWAREDRQRRDDSHVRMNAARKRFPKEDATNHTCNHQAVNGMNTGPAKTRHVTRLSSSTYPVPMITAKRVPLSNRHPTLFEYNSSTDEYTDDDDDTDTWDEVREILAAESQYSSLSEASSISNFPIYSDMWVFYISLYLVIL